MTETGPSPTGKLRLVIRRFDNPHPDALTATLGLEPDWTWVKGAVRRTPKGEVIGGPKDVHRAHGWCHSVPFWSTEDACTEAERLVSDLDRSRHVVEIAMRSGDGFLTADFFGESHSGFSVEPGSLAILSGLGFAVGAECFPRQGRMDEADVIGSEK